MTSWGLIEVFAMNIILYQFHNESHECSNVLHFGLWACYQINQLHCQPSTFA